MSEQPKYTIYYRTDGPGASKTAELQASWDALNGISVSDATDKIMDDLQDRLSITIKNPTESWLWDERPDLVTGICTALEDTREEPAKQIKIAVAYLAANDLPHTSDKVGAPVKTALEYIQYEAPRVFQNHITNQALSTRFGRVPAYEASNSIFGALQQTVNRALRSHLSGAQRFSSSSNDGRP